MQMVRSFEMMSVTRPICVYPPAAAIARQAIFSSPFALALLVVTQGGDEHCD